MKNFTVETVLEPVVDGNWTELRALTDVLPGTLLLEDAAEPTLIIPIEADNLRDAALYVQGVMSVLGHKVTWGRAYRAEPTRSHGVFLSSSRGAQHTSASVVPRWLEDPEETKRARDSVDA